MSDAPETRVERKERTRRALLDAALRLSADSSLVAVSLRQVAKEVGIVPTAFYRHFSSMDDLGLALVEDCFARLRALLRDVRTASYASDRAQRDMIDASIDVLRQHVTADRSHFTFIVRERAAGPEHVRIAIDRQLELVEHELATDLARLPGTEAWTAEDLRMLANLIVSLSVETTQALLRSDGAEQDRVTARARRQLRLLLVGAHRWRSRTQN